MSQFAKTSFLVLIAVAVALGSQVAVGSIYVTVSDFSGSRQTPTELGVTGASDWDGTGDNGFQISWDITSPEMGDDWWLYSYTISGKGGNPLSKGLSHLVLQITELKEGESFEEKYNIISYAINGNPNAGVTYEVDTYTADDNGNANPNLLDPIFGIKFQMPEGDVASFLVQFESKNAPVWGDFYAIDGKDTDPPTSAWNAGIETDPVIGSDNWELDYIAVPNGLGGGGGDPPPIPEPISIVIWVVGLLAFLAIGIRQRRNGAV